MYLHLTKTGRVTSQLREIEIGFTEHGGHFYLVAERESARRVRNIQSQPRSRSGSATLNSTPSRASYTMAVSLSSGATVKALFDAKYGWSNGLIVELTPA
jgi:hypothetical protein